MQKRRVIFSGGAGFLGSHFCENIVGQGNNALCADSYLYGRKQNVAYPLGSLNFEARPPRAFEQ